MLWFITSLLRGTLTRITFTKQSCLLPWCYGHDQLWLSWADLVQPLVLKISPHSRLTLGTIWGSGYRKGEADTTASTQDCTTIVCSWNIPDSKVLGSNMGPIWGRQDPGGPHVGPINFAIQDAIVIKIPKSTSNYFNQDAFLGISLLQKSYFETCMLIWYLSVKLTHNPLYVKWSDWLTNQYSSDQRTVSLNINYSTTANRGLID